MDQAYKYAPVEIQLFDSKGSIVSSGSNAAYWGSHAVNIFEEYYKCLKAGIFILKIKVKAKRNYGVTLYSKQDCSIEEENNLQHLNELQIEGYK